MAESLMSLLRDADPAHRKQAVIRLVRTTDVRAIKILTHLQTNDPDAEIRKLAAQGITHIRKQQLQAVAAHKSEPAPEKHGLSPDDVLQALELDTQTVQAAIAPLPPLKRRPVKEEPETKPVSRAYIRNLTVFAVICTIVGLGILYVALEDTLSRTLYMQNIDKRIQTAETFPYGGPPVGISLDGKTYFGRISEQMSYVIQEPSGIAPSAGWPLIVAVHGTNGSARDGLSWVGYEGQRSGAIVVAPTYPGMMEFNTSAHDMNVLLTELERYYPINQRAKVIFGFSGGGMFASLYTAEFRYFTGASIGGSPFFAEPPRTSPVRFIVVCGEDDDRLPASRGFSLAMSQRGTPVWHYEVIENIGHNVTKQQIDMTFELLDYLRYG